MTEQTDEQRACGAWIDPETAPRPLCTLPPRHEGWHRVARDAWVLQWEPGPCAATLPYFQVTCDLKDGHDGAHQKLGLEGFPNKWVLKWGSP